VKLYFQMAASAERVSFTGTIRGSPTWSAQAWPINWSMWQPSLVLVAWGCFGSGWWVKNSPL